jgi:hypothetical protein
VLIPVCQRRWAYEPGTAGRSVFGSPRSGPGLGVEKPGVEFLDDPPKDGVDARACSPEFRAKFTLDRWATTIADAIQAAQKMPGIDTSKAS